MADVQTEEAEFPTRKEYGRYKQLGEKEQVTGSGWKTACSGEI